MPYNSHCLLESDIHLRLSFCLIYKWRHHWLYQVNGYKKHPTYIGFFSLWTNCVLHQKVFFFFLINMTKPKKWCDWFFFPLPPSIGTLGSLPLCCLTVNATELKSLTWQLLRDTFHSMYKKQEPEMRFCPTLFQPGLIDVLQWIQRQSELK